MAKSEKIKEAWKDYWETLPEDVQQFSLENNGYVPLKMKLRNIPRDFLTVNMRKGLRPKSLSGIEILNHQFASHE